MGAQQSQASQAPPEQPQLSAPLLPQQGRNGAAEQDSANGEAAPGELSQGGQRRSYWEVAECFAVLGWTAFGGPTAHIARYHKSFVASRGWLSDSVFAELLALCQMLPGPSSSQMSFALGVLRLGSPLGGLVSGPMFLTPGLLLMSLAGLWASEALAHPPPALTAASAGLEAVAVALVAEAAVMLSQKLCKTRLTSLLCCTSAALAFAFPTQWLFPVLIAGGGLIAAYSTTPAPRSEVQVQAVDSERGGAAAPGSSSSSSSSSRSSLDALTHIGMSPWEGAALLLLWLLIFILAVALKTAVSYDTAPWLHWFEAFYVTGSVAYGGGQVMLPLLQHVVVQYDTVCPASGQCYQKESNSSWVSEQQFLTGLGVAQAMPGPLFNFSAYLGAIAGGLPGIVSCWLGLFGPGLLFIFGVLPFWSQFRNWAFYKRALPGLNSAAVGLIYASVFQLGLSTYTASPFPATSVSIAMIGFGSSAFLKIPAPLAVLGGALVGLAVFGAQHLLSPANTALTRTGYPPFAADLF